MAVDVLMCCLETSHFSRWWMMCLYTPLLYSTNACIQVDTLLNEAELEAEIASVKQRLTSHQLATLTVNTDTFPGNFCILYMHNQRELTLVRCN